MKFTLCVTSHGPQDKCFCLATLRIKKTSYRGDKSITSSITRALKPSDRELVGFSCLAIIAVDEVEITFSNNIRTRLPLTVSFIFEFLTLYKYKDNMEIDVRLVLKNRCQGLRMRIHHIITISDYRKYLPAFLSQILGLPILYASSLVKKVFSRYQWIQPDEMNPSAILGHSLQILIPHR